MPPATSPARMFRRAVSRSIARISISPRGRPVALDVGGDSHREEQGGEIGQGVEVGLQRPAAVARAVEAGGEVDEAGPEEHRGDEVGDAEAAGAEGELGDGVEEDGVEEDLAAGLLLAARSSSTPSS